MKFEVRVKPIPAMLRKKMQKVGREVGSLERPHRRIAVFLDKWVQQNFRSEGGKVGRWKPFKAGGRWVSTRTASGVGFQRSRPRRGSGRKKGTRYLDTSAKLLRDTRILSLSFTPFWSRNNAGIGVPPASRGRRMDYAKAHEDGDPARGLPQRRMLPKEHEVRTDIQRIYDAHLRDSKRRANLK